MKWFSTVLLISTVFAMTSGHIFGQCHPDSLEIPNNGIDEDCDGLDDIYLQLAPHFYAVEGTTFDLEFPNLILSQQPAKYDFEVVTSLTGSYDGDKWTWDGSNPAGNYNVEIKVKKPDGTVLVSGNMNVRVSASAAPMNNDTSRLWLVGHSFFDQGFLPNRLWDLTQANNNPPITFHGTRTAWGGPNIHHEGVGGAGAALFVSNLATNPLNINGINVNVRQYFEDEVGIGLVPNWIVIHFDVNDILSNGQLENVDIPAMDDFIVETWDGTITRIVDSIRTVAPTAAIGICTSPPAHGFQSAFDISFGPGNTVADRWRWQKIVNRLAYNNVAQWGSMENQNIYVIPLHIDMNDSTAYKPTDCVHPDANSCGGNPPNCGYYDIADQMYAWMRYLMFSPPSLPVEWTDVSALYKAGKVVVSWSTATEVDNKGFYVERSAQSGSDIEWKPLGFVQGNGTKSTPGNFEYEDLNPLSGVSYYRVRQEDFDGTSSYSPVVSMDIQLQRLSMRVSPNPAVDSFNIIVNVTRNAIADVQVINQGEEVVFTQTIELESNNPNTVRLDASSWPRGTYNIVLSTREQVIQQQLIVAKP